MLDGRDVDVVFSDISMPGLDGMALARVISRFSVRPQIVFVTAHDEHAVDAFALAATDYVMKPVRAERLSEAIRRVVVAQTETARGRRGRGRRRGRRERRHGDAGPPARRGERTAKDETIPVELGGVTRFITRSQIRYAQAHGDYARLHTETGSHLVRVPLSVLEERWADARVRAHPPQHPGRPAARQRGAHGPRPLLGRRRATSSCQVSRRHTKHLRDTLLRRPIGDRRPSGG